MMAGWPGRSTALAIIVAAASACDAVRASTVTASAILQHERMVNLMLMRRRLADLYRFGKKVEEWTTDPNFKSAVNTPGLLFPIPNIERQANPCIANPSACK
jgi:hypothetical protein